MESLESLQAKYDAVCKRILSEKSILAWIMKYCLEEYKDCTPEEIAEKYIEGTPEIEEVPVMPLIHGSGTEDNSPGEGTIFYDIRFQAIVPGTEGKIQIIVNLEAQNEFYPGYPLMKRALYYCSRMISSQYGTEFTHSEYDKLKKVYSIWLCFDPPNYRENTINRYYITEEQLVGSAQEKRENYDLLSVIMVCLGKPNHPEHPNALLRMLRTLLSEYISFEEKRKVLQSEFYISMSGTVEGDVVEVGSFLSEGMVRRSVQRGLMMGIQQGRKQGMQQGMQQGTETSTFKNLCSLMAGLQIPMERAMDLLEIEPGERQKYFDRLKNGQ